MNILPTDIELVNQLQTGNTEAFDLIYKKYSSRLFSFGMKYFRSTTEAEELVQTVFMKVWENHRKLKKELSFNSYLFTIAYNEICKAFRKRNYHQQFVDEFLAEKENASIDPEQLINIQSLLDRVEHIIDTLPEKQKSIFRKSRIEGMTTKEIAKEFGLSPGTIDNYLSETIKFVKKKIQKEGLMLLLFFFLFIA